MFSLKVFFDQYSRSFLLTVLVIIVVAAALRLWNLGGVPAGLTWDEAAIGYNGYSVATVYRDEWLERLPLTFKSYGDYKAPLAIYITGVFTLIFGLETWVIRLPFALSGVVFVAAAMALVWILSEKNKHRELLTILMGVFAALSPWHLLFSRAGFESGIAATLVLVGLLLFELAHRLVKHWLYAVSGIAFSLSMYAYHSAKIAVPLLLLCLFALYRKKLLKSWKQTMVFAAALTLTSLPLAYTHMYGEAMTRAGVLIFSSDLSAYEMVVRVLQNLIGYMSPGFLLFGEADSLRHSTGQFGVLSIATFLLGVVGVGSILLGLIWGTLRPSKIHWLGLTILLAGVLPAALVVESEPHPNRSLLALVGYLLVAVAGAEILLRSFSLKKSRIFFILIIAAELIFATFFLRFYFLKYNTLIGDEYLQGYQEVFSITEQYRDPESDIEMVDTIVFSSEYGQPYMYALIAKNASPYDFHAGVLRHYLFVDEIQVGDFSRNNALLVATGNELDNTEEPLHVVTDAAGAVRFRVYRTDKIEESTDE